MLRLFVALALPNQIRDQIAPIQSGLPDARWVRQENLHLTIRFIGEVENSLAEEMHFALSKLSFETFSFRLQGIDTFPLTEVCPFYLDWYRTFSILESFKSKNRNNTDRPWSSSTNT